MRVGSSGPGRGLPEPVLTCLRFFEIVAKALAQMLRFAAGSGLALFRDDRRSEIEKLGGRCLAVFFRNLGATFIKLGQILSARPDILPPAVIAELEVLQDRVPQFGFEDARRIIEEDLGQPIESVYAELDPEPIAAASIAQVHEGRLPAGEHVAVKVQRPRIAQLMRRDLAILRGIVRPLDFLPGGEILGASRMVGEIAKKIEGQLDFPGEVANNLRFAANLEGLSFVRLPAIHAELCGPRVITMEFIEGRKLTDALDDLPIPGPVLADRVIELYMNMAFGDFFIHADLHPGNVFIDGDGNLVLLDTGLVHEIPRDYIRRFLRSYMAIMAFDGELLVDAYLEGREVPESRRRAAAAAGDEFLKKYDGVDIADIEFGKAMLEMFRLMRRHRIYVDEEFAGYFLSEITFEGIAKMLDAEVDLMVVVPAKIPALVARHDFIDTDDPVLARLASRVEGPSSQRPA